MIPDRGIDVIALEAAHKIEELLTRPPASVTQLTARIQIVVIDAIKAWAQGRLDVTAAGVKEVVATALASESTYRSVEMRRVVVKGV